ncbi:MAG: hypothetical protein SOV58_06650 [Candidatus Enteromonas sp.]|nr:hypothetical protein [Candidatus Enteromonas sp.]
MAKNGRFLENFAAAYLAKLTERPASFLSAHKGLSFLDESPYEDALRELQSIKQVLDKILSICYRPHIEASVLEVVKRSELAGKLSAESTERTLRDPKLWKEKEGRMSPEYVHSVETVDSLLTYENRFLAFYIDLLEGDLEAILFEINPLMDSFLERYGQTGLSFGEFSFARDIRRQKEKRLRYPLVRLRGRDEAFGLAKRLLRKVKHLQETELYAAGSSHPLTLPIVPNNVLLHDPKYGYCYKSYASRKNDPSLGHEEAFYVYAVASLLKVLPSPKCSGKAQKTKDGWSFPEVTFSIPPFRYSLSFDVPGRTIEFDCRFLNGEQTLEERKALLLPVRKLEMQGYLQKKNSYASYPGETIFLTLDNRVCSASRIAMLSCFKKGNDDILLDLIYSLGMAMEVDQEAFSSRCPLCGSDQIRFDGKHYHCLACEGEYGLHPYQESNVLCITRYGKEGS